jgi:hypothetical protein
MNINYQPNENSDQQQQDDLFSTFDFPVLSELSRTGKDQKLPCLINIKYYFLRSTNRWIPT